MALSGGAGFQSTQPTVGSPFLGGKTSTARTFFSVDLASAVMSMDEAPVGAVDRRGVGHLLAVEPDVGPVVDAVELEAGAGEAGALRHGEFLAVPPGDGEGLRGHVGEVLAEVDVLVDVVLDERPQHGRGDDGRVPGLDLEAGQGDLFPRALGLRRRLEIPEVAERHGPVEEHPGFEAGFFPAGHGLIGVLGKGNRRDGGQRDEKAEGREYPEGFSEWAGANGDHVASRNCDASIISERPGRAKRLPGKRSEISPCHSAIPSIPKRPDVPGLQRIMRSVRMPDGGTSREAGRPGPWAPSTSLEEDPAAAGRLAREAERFGPVGSVVEPQDPGLSVRGGLEGNGDQGIGLDGERESRRGRCGIGRDRDERGRGFQPEPLGRGRVRSEVRRDGVAQGHRAFLVGLVVRVPVVVHGVGVERRRGLELAEPDPPFALPRGLVGEGPDLDERRVEGGPGHAEFPVRDVDAVAGAEEIAAGPLDLVGFGPHRGPAEVDPDGAAGDGEGETDVDALLLPHFLLVEGHRDVETVQAPNGPVFADQPPFPPGRVRPCDDRGQHGPLDEAHAALGGGHGFPGIDPRHIEIMPETRELGSVDELAGRPRARPDEAADGAGLSVDDRPQRPVPDLGPVGPAGFHRVRLSRADEIASGPQSRHVPGDEGQLPRAEPLRRDGRARLVLDPVARLPERPRDEDEVRPRAKSRC